MDDDENSQEYAKAPYYFEKLKELKETEEVILDVDCDHIRQYDKQLYR
jgi:hypothetical protein